MTKMSTKDQSSNEVKLGLTLGQILSILALLGSIGGLWVSMSVRMAENELNTKNNKDNIEQLREDYKKSIEKIDGKLDKLIENKNK